MKRRFIPLILCLAFVLLFSACGAPADVDGAMTPIKDENGAVTGYERKYHNDNGDVTRWDVYDASEQYDHYVLYEYDSNGRLGKETYYRAVNVSRRSAGGEQQHTEKAKDQRNESALHYLILEWSLTVLPRLSTETSPTDGDWVEKPLPTESTESTEADAE